MVKPMNDFPLEQKREVAQKKAERIGRSSSRGMAKTGRTYGYGRGKTDRPGPMTPRKRRP